MAVNSTAITKIGFKKADTKIARRLIVGIEAQEKCGKTNFLLSSPGPIAVFDFNNSLEGVVNKFANMKDIFISDYSKSGSHLSTPEWLKIWEKFKKEYVEILREPSIKTMGIDTATEQWELCRMARFGKLTQVMPHMYGPVNEEFRNLLYIAYSSGKNIILTHKKKEEYVASKANPAISNRTGKYIRSGFADSPYMVQVNIDLWRDPDEGFKARIMDCRQNADIIGMELYGEDINFPMLASLVFPEIDISEWGG